MRFVRQFKEKLFTYGCPNCRPRPKVIDAKYIKDYALYIRFPDGSEGEVDFEQELEGEIFAPLNDISYFKNFTVNLTPYTFFLFFGVGAAVYPRPLGLESSTGRQVSNKSQLREGLYIFRCSDRRSSPKVLAADYP